MKAKFLVFFIGLSLLISFNFAQAQITTTTPDLEALVQALHQQIEDLRERILQLQEQLKEITTELKEAEKVVKFTQNLHKGLRDKEVERLQEFLSKYPEIYPEGLVTGYFGPLTEGAVKKFQEKHSDDILKPYGLNKGTGFVGEKTIAKINEILAEGAGVSGVIPPGLITAPGIQKKLATTTESERKITICHYPPGNPDARHTIIINESALEAHLAHGDTIGACEDEPEPDPTDTTPPVISNFQPSGTITDITPTLSLNTDEDATCKYVSTTDQSFDAMPNTFSGAGTTYHYAALGTMAAETYTYYARCEDTVGNKNTSSASTTFTITTETADTTPPVIFNIQVSNITETSATIIWQTDEESDSVVNYGLTTSYGSTVSGETAVTYHEVNLSNLTDGTVYHYQVKSTDNAGNQTQSSDRTFTTLTSTSDTIPPANVTNFTAVGGDGQVNLSWVNPTDADFAGTRILRKTGDYPIDVTDGTQIYTGIGTSYTDIGVTNGTRYYYKAFTYDEVPNYSSGVGVTAIPILACAGAPQFLLKWGSYGSGDGQFHRPYDIAIDSGGNVYVTDIHNYRIQKFTSDGTFITKWDSRGTDDGQFRPYGVAIDASGNIYVVDENNDRIQKFTSDGTFITKWGSFGTGDGQFDTPGGIAIDGNSNVYVTERYNHRVQKFTSDGTFILKWGSRGTGGGQLNYPYDITVDASGNVYVVNVDNVQKFTSDGTFISKWGSFGTGDGQFQWTGGIAIDSGGNVYVTDTGNHRVQKFTSNGTFILKWGSRGTGDGQFADPYGIAVDDSGNVYVVEIGNDRVQKFAPCQVAISEQEQ